MNDDYQTLGVTYFTLKGAEFRDYRVRLQLSHRTLRLPREWQTRLSSIYASMLRTSTSTRRATRRKATLVVLSTLRGLTHVPNVVTVAGDVARVRSIVTDSAQLTAHA